MTIQFNLLIGSAILMISVWPMLLSAQTSKVRLSSLQSQIQSCGVEVEKLNEIKTFDQIYKGISKYTMLSEKIVYRELVYKFKNERRKLKVINNEIEIYKIGDEDRHYKMPIEPRQKSKTVRAAISQYILNMKIESDWEKITEERVGGLQVEFVRDNGNMSQLSLKFSKADSKLECLIVNQSEICLCNK